MLLHTIRLAALFVALALGNLAFGQAAAPEGPAAAAAPPEAGSVSAARAKPFEQVVKLWKAGLSEEFLRRKIERESVVYELSTDDIIACKTAGVPESIIEAMMKTGGPPAPAAEAVVAPPVEIAPVAPAPPVAVAPPVPPSVPVVPSVPMAAAPPAAPAATVPSPAARADRSWDGLVRRSPGVVLFRPRWEPGKLSFVGDEIRWLDAGDEARNVVLPLAKIQEQFLVCPNDASSDAGCYEWGVKTADAEFRFRDAGGKREMSSKPLDLFTSLQALAPNLAAKKYIAKKE